MEVIEIPQEDDSIKVRLEIEFFKHRDENIDTCIHEVIKSIEQNYSKNL